jgi:alpha-1,2-mannosyltransferase
MVLAAIVMWKRAPDALYGFDFRGGAWVAGRELLHGVSPYVKPDPRLLFGMRNAFVTPPLLAVIAAPFSLLPFKLAIALWSITCVGAFLTALRLVGLRDWRMYAVALCSLPLVESLWTGQPDGVLALLLALAWRYRDSWRGALAIGALIAAKLVAWPLLLWLLVTKRYRLTAVSAASALILLVASWALIDFKGLGLYPRLLAADARAFENWMYSVSAVGGLMHMGLSAHLATLMSISFGLAVALCVAALARGSDEGWFTAAVVLALLASPILWAHYLVALFVPLALAKRSAIAPWLVGCALWVCLLEGPFAVRVGVTLAATVVVGLWSTACPRSSSVSILRGLATAFGLRQGVPAD